MIVTDAVLTILDSDEIAVFTQHFPALDLSALAVFLNSQEPPKQPRKRRKDAGKTRQPATGGTQ